MKYFGGIRFRLILKKPTGILLEANGMNWSGVHSFLKAETKLCFKIIKILRPFIATFR